MTIYCHVTNCCHYSGRQFRKIFGKLRGKAVACVIQQDE